MGPHSGALDFLSLPFHRGILKAHLVYRLESAFKNLSKSVGEGMYRRTAEDLRIARGNLVGGDENGARWFTWPPNMQLSPASSRGPDIGLPTNPNQLHELWSRLSAEEKDARYRADQFVGNRDGIPQRDRDKYNRQTLLMLREKAAREQNEDHIKVLDDIQKFLDSTEEGLPPHYLSYIDDKLRYAYTIGNPDTAHNVGIALVGALRRRSGVGYAQQSLKQLRQAALAVDPTKETSIVLWGAYDNPNSLVATLSSKPAEEGADALRRYHEGLRATHQGPPSHNTTIAHSYGGVLGGHSAGHGNALDTDELVFVGNWGAGVPNVGDLRLTGVDPAHISDHVYATMAQHDSIQLMPATHGPAPTDPEFNATVFGTDSTPSLTRLGWNPQDHLATNYFGSDNQSYRSLGLIMTGHGDMLR
ncbi:alpha/beta hydrolase [Nocardia sp. NPDC049220]|uniref:alpha/beta hydrolase n=1 Tax=Nocardia sp. NPDC049220 TaxID=3155273 RepID=UPI0033C97A76